MSPVALSSTGLKAAQSVSVVAMKAFDLLVGQFVPKNDDYVLAVNGSSHQLNDNFAPLANG